MTSFFFLDPPIFNINKEVYNDAYNIIININYYVIAFDS